MLNYDINSLKGKNPVEQIICIRLGLKHYFSKTELAKDCGITNATLYKYLGKIPQGRPDQTLISFDNK